MKNVVAGEMIRNGTDFFKAIGRALLVADEVETEKIHEAFTDDWQRFLDDAEMERYLSERRPQWMVR
jgi:hypothetical protein